MKRFLGIKSEALDEKTARSQEIFSKREAAFVGQKMRTKLQVVSGKFLTLGS